MYDLVTQGGGYLARSDAKAYGRGVAHIQYRTGTSLVRVDGEVAVQEAVAEGVASVGATAMRQIAMVSQLEVQLGQLVPAAVSRLQAIGDMTALAMADVVSSTACRLNRAR